MKSRSERIPGVSRGLPLLGAALFLSGAAGLIDEVAWTRRAAVFAGSTTWALGAVLAVFLSGLSIGAALFGRLSAGSTRPLRLLAALEAALAVGGPLVTAFLDDAGQISLALSGPGGENPAAAAFVRAMRASLILLPAALLMGGSWALAVADRARRRFPRSTDQGPLLYALNTLGGCSGALLAGFGLIPTLGTLGASLVAAVLNGAAAVLALQIDAHDGPLPARRPDVEDTGPPGTGVPGPPPIRAIPARLIPCVFFGSGLLVLGFEVMWGRFLSLLVTNTVYTTTLVLALTLAGLGAGALTATGVRSPRALAAAQIGAALLALLTLSLPVPFWRALFGQSDAGLARGAILAICPTTLLLGLVFPMAVRLEAAPPGRAGLSAGRAAAISTLGGIAGSRGVAFLLLPSLGLEASARILTGLALGLGSAVLLASPARGRAASVFACGTLLAWSAWPLMPRPHLPHDYLRTGGELLAVEEGYAGCLSVVRSGGRRRLEIDRLWQGENGRTHQVLAAHLPLLLHPGPRRVLVVGLGAGQTARRFLTDRVERLDLVDVEPSVFRLAGTHFDGAWLSDGRVRRFVEDGRLWLAREGDPYDIVSLELGQTFRPGVAGFYSREFYRQVRSRLEPDGLVVQFIPVAFVTGEELSRLLRTFLAEFPASRLWYNTTEFLLVGCAGDPPRWDPGRWRRRLSDPAVRNDLAFSPRHDARALLDDEAVFLSGYLCGPAGLARMTGPGALYRDDPPHLEYESSRRRRLDTRELLALLRSGLDPIDTFASLDERTHDRILGLREENLADLEAVLQASGTPSLLRLRDAVRRSPSNAQLTRRLGRALLQSGDELAGLAALQRAARLSPEDAEARYDLGRALVVVRRGTEALPELEAAVELAPEHREAKELLALARASLGVAASGIGP
jgi:spermidine synthase